MNTAEVFWADHPVVTRKDDGMTTTLKFAILLGNAVGASLIFALPVTASPADADDDIVVVSAGAMQKWQQETNARLDRALQVAAPRDAVTGNSIVQITFTRGPDGKPENPQFYNREGNWTERWIARRAVQSLDNLGEVPVVEAGQVRFLANVIFADDYHNLRKLRSRLEVMERERLAAPAANTWRWATDSRASGAHD
jgi:hypothetical protein